MPAAINYVLYVCATKVFVDVTSAKTNKYDCTPRGLAANDTKSCQNENILGEGWQYHLPTINVKGVSILILYCNVACHR